MNEAQTRRELIDKALEQARWHVTNKRQVGIEIPVDGFDPSVWQALQATLKRAGLSADTELPKGISDYVLYRDNGEILAVVEAKRTSTDPRLAEAQARFYVGELAKQQGFTPFAFMTNGRKIYFLEAGVSSKREVRGFFTKRDLERLLAIRERQTPLATTPINNAITDRPYQHEAVRRVGEAFDAGKRRTLLVMATGTGKTRTAMSTVDVFMRSGQARHILFVADRDALVDQALTEGFREHLPDEPATRIYSHKIDSANRLFVVTLQTIDKCFKQFSPAFFDLIIFDEVHRSIFNKWSDPVQYFDARMIGLTATPASFIDRNTFVEFGCPDGVATFAYSYKQAVAEGYLVDFELVQAQTGFQRKGIRGADLSEEEKNTLIEQGIDPDDLELSGTDLERTASNRDTLRQQWQEIMDTCRFDKSGQLIGKTIVFAMTQDHALRLADVFNEMYPQYPDLATVITYQSDYKGNAIKRFKGQSEPRIAISVDMLETGVNVPEAVNLVFMRPVQSGIKLAQMIGRGTRTQEACKHLEWLPGGEKKDFLILDFWQNDFEKDPSQAPPPSLPVLVTVFNTRLKLMQRYLETQTSPEAERTRGDLREMIARIPRESYNVEKQWEDIAGAWEDGFWSYLTKNKLDFLRNRVAPLLRYAAGVDVAAETFTSKVERLKLQLAHGDASDDTLQAVAEDVSRLPEFVYSDEANKASYELALSANLRSASPAELDQLIERLAPQMKNRRDKPDAFLEFDLKDMIAVRSHIVLDERGEPLYAQAYQQRVEDRILELVMRHPAMQAVEAGGEVSDTLLIDLERVLYTDLEQGPLHLTPRNIRRAYNVKVESLLGFVRYLLGIEHFRDYGDIVTRQFDAYITGNAFSANQIYFLRAVKSVFLAKRSLHVADLYEAPLTAFGQDAVERYFSQAEIDDVLAFTRQLAVTDLASAQV